MKNFNILIFCLSLLTFASCKKEGCTDINATNFKSDADTDDGSCVYRTINPMTGTFNTTSICIANVSFNHQVTVSEMANNQINIFNLNDWEDNVIANVDGNQITFAYDDALINYVGNGELVNDTLFFSYEIYNTNNKEINNCTATCVK